MKKERNETRDLRQFGAVLAGILLVAGAINFFKGRISWCPWFFGPGLVVVVLVFAAPKSIKPIFILFTKIGHIIGWINTRIILILVYYILITPIALIMKIFRKDLLDIKIDKNKISYWTNRSTDRSAKEALEKQF